jgi:hypothetical protein
MYTLNRTPVSYKQHQNPIKHKPNAYPCLMISERKQKKKARHKTKEVQPLKHQQHNGS